MTACTADATWNGTLVDGDGEVALGSGAWEGPYGTPDAADASNPEELVAAGHASCFAMTMAHALSEAGYAPERVDAESTVHLAETDEGFHVPTVELSVEGVVPDATPEEFAAVAETAEGYCPVSSALSGPDVELTASLVTGGRTR